MPSRRSVLAGIASASLVPGLGWAKVGNPIALSAGRGKDGGFLLAGLTASGDIAFQLLLPGRGHAAAAHPTTAEVVAIARRPGRFAKVIDLTTGNVTQTLDAPDGLHFYGHGAFSADGTLLFTTENEFETGMGRIGVWDRSLGYKRVGEFSSGGVGPHEILRLPSGDLAVANGGIRTHPKTGRDKLNLDTMRSTLCVFSTDGVLRDRAEVAVETHQNSLRHIAVQTDGTIACGFQWQGDPFASPSLVSLYRGNAHLVPIQAEPHIWRGTKGYIGSVSAFGTTGFVVSAPRQGRIMTVAPAGRIAKVHHAFDACGLSPASATACLVTDGVGHVYQLDDQSMREVARHDIAFDNHLVAVSS